MSDIEEKIEQVVEMVDRLDMADYIAVQKEVQHVEAMVQLGKAKLEADLELAKHKLEVARLNMCIKYKINEGDEINGSCQIVRK